mgnify:CR=1 FL=1
MRSLVVLVGVWSLWLVPVHRRLATWSPIELSSVRRDCRNAHPQPTTDTTVWPQLRRWSHSSKARQSEGFQDAGSHWTQEAEGSNSSLRMVFLVHRHGDRMPLLIPQNSPLQMEPIRSTYAPGQLTNEGKARLYLLGGNVRKRYNQFLGRSVNKNRVMTRSSSASCCLESAQMFLAGLLPLDLANSSDSERLVWGELNNKLAHLWQPAAISSAPRNFDGMLSLADCKLVANRIGELHSNGEILREFAKLEGEAEILENHLGYEIDSLLEWVPAADLLEMERRMFPQEFALELAQIYDRVLDASDLAFRALQQGHDRVRLRIGLLLGDINSLMLDTSRPDEPTSSDPAPMAKQFVQYSTHDLYVASLLAVLGEWTGTRACRPDHGASVLIELHRNDPTGGWFVRAFHVPQTPGPIFELKLWRCTRRDGAGRCTLDGFGAMLQPFIITSWAQWMRECGNELEGIEVYATAS